METQRAGVAGVDLSLRRQRRTCEQRDGQGRHTHRTCPQGAGGQLTERPRLGGAGKGRVPALPRPPLPGRHVGRAEAPGRVGAPSLRPRVSYTQ